MKCRGCNLLVKEETVSRDGFCPGCWFIESEQDDPPDHAPSNYDGEDDERFDNA